MRQVSHDEEIERHQAMLCVEVEDLDEECRQHANMHSEIALNAARAASRAAELKLDMKEIEGEWQTEARDRLNAAGKGDGPKGRVTDKQIDAELASHPNRVIRNREIAKVEAEARDWDALRESSKERGYQLRNLVDMMISGLITPRAAKPSRRTAKKLEDKSARARL